VASWTSTAILIPSGAQPPPRSAQTPPVGEGAVRPDVEGRQPPGQRVGDDQRRPVGVITAPFGNDLRSAATVTDPSWSTQTHRAGLSWPALDAEAPRAPKIGHRPRLPVADMGSHGWYDSPSWGDPR